MRNKLYSSSSEAFRCLSPWSELTSHSNSNELALTLKWFIKRMNYISKRKISPNLETISSSMLISSSTMDVSDSMIKCSLHSINNSMMTWHFRNNLASRFCQLNRCQPACMKSNTSIRPFKSSMELPMRTHTISSKSELQSTNPYNILRVRKLLRLLVCWLIWD